MEGTVGALRIAPSWTIKESLEKSAKVREEWDRSFDKNWQELAQEIATAVGERVLTSFKKSLENPFSKKWLGNLLFFNITRAKHSEVLCKLAPVSAEKEPFKSWFDLFARGESRFKSRFAPYPWMLRILCYMQIGG